MTETTTSHSAKIHANLLTESENPYENFYDLSILSQKMNEFF